MSAKTPRERSIMLRTPEVRDILEGRKTQLRRIVKEQPASHEHIAWCTNIIGGPPGFAAARPMSSNARRLSCPYGQPGDRLWVRETWALENPPDDGELLIWQADRSAAWRPLLGERFHLSPNYQPNRWRPAINMPRWASRLTLEVVSVRVERLQDISEADARAEGVEPKRGAGGAVISTGPVHLSHVVGFRELWCSINGPESWDANPWVWVVEFRRVETPHD